MPRCLLLPCTLRRAALCRDKWESEVDIEEIMRVPEKRRRLRWRTLALVATGSVLLTTALVRYGRQR